jgi:hypothetical protein
VTGFTCLGAEAPSNDQAPPLRAKVARECVYISSAGMHRHRHHTNTAFIVTIVSAATMHLSLCACCLPLLFLLSLLLLLLLLEFKAKSAVGRDHQCHLVKDVWPELQQGTQHLCMHEGTWMHKCGCPLL